jgi:hypothetical protein
MTTLIPIINEITQFGLSPNLPIADKETVLERNLVKIYALYFEVDTVSDATNYPVFPSETLPNIRENIESNFKDFGFYNVVLDLYEVIDPNKKVGLGDAVDDLLDITKDLLEVKWRMENNSLADGLYFFKFIFSAHTQQHILDLLNFMKEKRV